MGFLDTVVWLKGATATTGGPEGLQDFQERVTSTGFRWATLVVDDQLIENLRETEPAMVWVDGATVTTEAFDPYLNDMKADKSLEAVPVMVVGDTNGWAASPIDGVFNNLAPQGEVESVWPLLERLVRRHQRSLTLAQQMSEMNAELYDRNCLVERELYVARQLQQSLLPPIIEDENPEPQYSEEELLMNPDLAERQMTRFSKKHYDSGKIRVSGIYFPCDALGGDMYDIIPFKDGSVGVTVADVSGHGVPAGFITAIFKASLYRMTITYNEPNDILFHLNNELANIVKTGDYVTGVYCHIGPEGRMAQYSGAGHPYPMCYRKATDSIERLAENGTPLVWIPDMDYPLGEIELNPGDKVFIFTDGISEINNANKDILGEEALEAHLLKAIRGSEDGEILNQLMVSVSTFTEGYPLQDDISMVLIEAIE